MEIVRADETHRNLVYALMHELEGDKLDRDCFEAVYLRNLADEHIFSLLAMDAGAALGFLSLHIQFLLHHAGMAAEIQEIVVSEAHRGQGIGEKLFLRARQIAAERGCVLLEVCCNQSRAHSHQFYLRQGMKNTHYKFTMPLA